MKRIQSIDFARGAVMVIMALDHVRDLMHINSVTQSPTNLTTTTPLLFLTRFITYFCAPTFVFLAGTSAFLSFTRKNDISYSRNYLISRGIVLIIIELTIVNFGMFFDLGFHTYIFEVIATIGFGFIMLGLMINLPPMTVGIIGLVIIFCHNLFPLIPFNNGSTIKLAVSQFFLPGAIPISANRVFIMAYPPIPWLGIMLAGFAAGKLFTVAALKRRKIFLGVGLSALLLFVVLRFINIYGDPSVWSPQKNFVYTCLSFINVTKYPPSLLFCLITLGVLFLVFAFIKQSDNKLISTISVYGKVPMFYFLVHFYLIHILMIMMLLLQGFHWADFDFASGNFGRPKNLQSGIGLWKVYVIWVLVVIILYKPCLWYWKYKSTHKNWWLKYL